MYDITAIKSVPSKRGILSVIARIFDPLGFLSPVIFYAKCIMQRLWAAQTSWDDPLPSAIAEVWQEFMGMLS
ncbi:Integrase catalytic domain-containing protein [Aphis craccivora]|uniref:Integrase catalytic domain-containing protein n=1 Tax=Aphis craccivora TaxID=307492 RepID=A0A6G0YFG6_APHCR|nr:Integrase catalytic domain-containing protein [Aphis craccivora]